MLYPLQTLLLLWFSPILTPRNMLIQVNGPSFPKIEYTTKSKLNTKYVSTESNQLSRNLIGKIECVMIKCGTTFDGEVGIH